MKHLINILYGITQQGDIFQNNSVKSIESYCGLSKNVLTWTGGRGIFENDSVKSDCRDKSDVSKTAYQWIVLNHSTRRDLSK